MAHSNILPNLSSTGQNESGVAVHDDRIYVVGGYSIWTNEPLACIQVRLLDSTCNSCDTSASHQTKRYELSCFTDRVMLNTSKQNNTNYIVSCEFNLECYTEPHILQMVRSALCVCLHG